MSNGRPEIRRFTTIDELSRAAAFAICAELRSAVSARGRFVMAMAGGTTPEGLYDVLAASPFRDRVDWQRVHLFFGDERAVPAGDPGSNFHMVDEHLLRCVSIPEGQVHRIAADALDLQIAAGEYASVVTMNVRPEEASGPPSFDVILLGLGADGHTASLFPGSRELAETRQWYVPSTSPVPPVGRITATLPLINAARNVFFLVSGADKAEALAAVFTEPDDGPRLPAQLVAPLGRLVWFVDDAAAGQLLSIASSTWGSSEAGSE